MIAANEGRLPVALVVVMTVPDSWRADDGARDGVAHGHTLLQGSAQPFVRLEGPILANTDGGGQSGKFGRQRPLRLLIDDRLHLFEAR